MNETRPRVLVIEDERHIQRALQASLSAAGYDVECVGAGTEGLNRVAQAAPDAILLDLGLPDMDGKDVILSLREWTLAPVIVISARHDESERIAALDNGADDYVTKPFLMGELHARLRAALRYRQRRAAGTKTFSAGGLNIDFARRRVMLFGQEVKLTRKEFDLLGALAQHAGQVVTHKQLLAAGWGASVTDTQFVRVYVGQIRQKIEEDASAPRIILTEAGVGYRLVADEI